jgi:hypothetical protein
MAILILSDQYSMGKGFGIQQECSGPWSGTSQVRGIRLLVQMAMKDPLNHRFCMISEACTPLVPFPKLLADALMNFDKSIINARAMDIGEMELPTRWRDSLFNVGFKKEHWRKSATWFSLQRQHASIFANVTHLDAGWESVPSCLLCLRCMDKITILLAQMVVHVNWPSLMASQSRTFGGDDITAELFASIQRPVASHAGFGAQCSGVKDILPSLIKVSE